MVIIDNANENEFVWVPVPYVVAENGNIEEKTKDVIIIDAKDKESKIKSIENITTENIIKISETKYEVTENGEYIFRVKNNAEKYIDYKVIISDIVETGNSAMAILQAGEDTKYQGVLYDFEGTTATKKELATIGSGNGYREPDTLTQEQYDANADNLAIINNILGTTYSTIEQFGDALQSDFNSIVASVSKYKGFYIGRYEVSINTTTKTAYSKKGVLPATATTTTGNTWYGLYAYQKKMADTNGYTSVNSNMIWRV